MKRKIRNTIILSFIVLGMIPVFGSDTFAQQQVDVEYMAATRETRSDSRMLYHYGPIMAYTSNTYFIWYGNWNDRAGSVAILNDFITSIGGSAYMAINSTYPNNSGQAPSGGLVFGGGAVDLYSHGSSLTEADVEDIVADALGTGALPQDTRGIYFVLASPDVTAEGFCIQRCQYHKHFAPFGADIKYAFVGNPDRCPASCSPQFRTSADAPNADRAADAMASWIAHVINEVVTNPNGTAWYDRYGLENSDKCAGKYGETYLTANGGIANMRLGFRDYLIQQNWVNGRKGRCALSYP